MSFTIAAQNLLIRPMSIVDINAVYQVQRSCYTPEYHESTVVLTARLQQAPDTAWVAECAGEVVGYIVAYLSLKGHVTPLHHEFDIHQQPTCLYIHDLAVAPWAHGQGVAGQLLACAKHAAHQQALSCALVAVQDAQAFWRKHGFDPLMLCDNQRARLASYGSDACYMHYAHRGG